jgi:Na+-driven multidrug efflux pump
MLFTFPGWFGLNGVWLAHPCSSVPMFFIALIWTKREFQEFPRDRDTTAVR